MADLNTPTTDELSPDYLGRPTREAFSQQPQLPVTGGPAVGAPTAPLVTGSGVVAPPAGGVFGTGPTETGPAGAQVRRPQDFDALQAALFGVKSGMKLTDLAREIFSTGPAAGGIDTPSGQITISAPEILREAQFGGNVPDVPGGTFEGEGGLGAAAGAGGGVDAFDAAGGALAAGAGGGVDAFGVAGGALAAGGGLYGLARAIQGGDPGSIVGAVPQAVLGLASLASQFGVDLATEIVSAAGPWAIVAPAFTQVISSLFRDMLSDPHKEAAADQAWDAARNMPTYLGLLQAEPAVLRAQTKNMSNDDVKMLYMLARSGVRASELAANPIFEQGRSEHGVRQPTFPGAEAEIQALMPSALAATIHLQDELTRRGIGPDEVQLPKTEFWRDPRELSQAQSIAQLSGGPGDEGSPSRALYDWQTLVPAQTMFLSPQELARTIGAYGGLDADALTAQQQSQIAALQPGQLESGLRGIVPTDSALGQLWASLGGSDTSGASLAGAEGAPTQAGEGPGSAEASSPLTAADRRTAFGPQDVSQAFGGGAGWLEDLLRGGAP